MANSQSGFESISRVENFTASELASEVASEVASGLASKEAPEPQLNLLVLAQNHEPTVKSSNPIARSGDSVTKAGALAAKDSVPVAKAGALAEKDSVTVAKAGALVATGADFISDQKEAQANSEAQSLEIESKLYPELTLFRQAMETLKNKEGDQKQNFEIANSYFHVAEIQLENYIEYQGGVTNMLKQAGLLADELYKAVDEFRAGTRSIEGPDFEGKKEIEARMRAELKDLSKQDILAALRGEKGFELRKSLFDCLNEDEKEMLAELDLALNKIQLLSSVKLQHALATNAFAIANNDPSAKILAENILKSIAASDPEGYRNNPEIRGLLLQSQYGQPMDLREGKAFATALCEEAQKTIVRMLMSADYLFDGEARMKAAEQAVGLLAAALAANGDTTRKMWASFPESKNYEGIFKAAETVVSGKSERP